LGLVVVELLVDVFTECRIDFLDMFQFDTILLITFFKLILFSLHIFHNFLNAYDSCF
jgi:hypothetical protein